VSQVDFELTEEQAALREVSRAMLAANCAPRLVRALADAGQDTDDKLWQRAAELGWTGLAVPAGLDGASQGLAELCLVAGQLKATWAHHGSAARSAASSRSSTRWPTCSPR
jgi:alkylation response protein AidB-like acyl-CoA dehydrogenase